MRIYPPDSTRWSLRLPETLSFVETDPLNPSGVLDNDDPMRPVTPMGSEEVRQPEEDLRQPYYSLGETRMTTGIMPSQNTPGTTGRIAVAVMDKGVVSSNVGDSDTTVSFTLPNRGGTETATLLFPYDSDAADLYAASDCLPQYEENDEIFVFQVEDGTWYAPGPFIPVEKIKEIFAC